MQSEPNGKYEHVLALVTRQQFVVWDFRSKVIDLSIGISLEHSQRRICLIPSPICDNLPLPAIEYNWNGWYEMCVFLEGSVDQGGMKLP